MSTIRLGELEYAINRILPETKQVSGFSKIKAIVTGEELSGRIAGLGLLKRLRRLPSDLFHFTASVEVRSDYAKTRDKAIAVYHGSTATFMKRPQAIAAVVAQLKPHFNDPKNNPVELYNLARTVRANFLWHCGSYESQLSGVTASLVVNHADSDLYHALNRQLLDHVSRKLVTEEIGTAHATAPHLPDFLSILLLQTNSIYDGSISNDAIRQLVDALERLPRTAIEQRLNTLRGESSPTAQCIRALLTRAITTPPSPPYDAIRAHLYALHDTRIPVAPPRRPTQTAQAQQTDPEVPPAATVPTAQAPQTAHPVNQPSTPALAHASTLAFSQHVAHLSQQHQSSTTTTTTPAPQTTPVHRVLATAAVPAERPQPQASVPPTTTHAQTQPLSHNVVPAQAYAPRSLDSRTQAPRAVYKQPPTTHTSASTEPDNVLVAHTQLTSPFPHTEYVASSPLSHFEGRSRLIVENFDESTTPKNQEMTSLTHAMQTYQESMRFQAATPFHEERPTRVAAPTHVTPPLFAPVVDPRSETTPEPQSSPPQPTPQRASASVKSPIAQRASALLAQYEECTTRTATLLSARRNQQTQNNFPTDQDYQNRPAHELAAPNQDQQAVYDALDRNVLQHRQLHQSLHAHQTLTEQEEQERNVAEFRQMLPSASPQAIAALSDISMRLGINATDPHFIATIDARARAAAQEAERARITVKTLQHVTDELATKGLDVFNDEEFTSILSKLMIGNIYLIDTNEDTLKREFLQTSSKLLIILSGLIVTQDQTDAVRILQTFKEELQLVVYELQKQLIAKLPEETRLHARVEKDRLATKWQQESRATPSVTPPSARTRPNQRRAAPAPAPRNTQTTRTTRRAPSTRESFGDARRRESAGQPHKYPIQAFAAEALAQGSEAPQKADIALERNQQFMQDRFGSPTLLSATSTSIPAARPAALSPTPQRRPQARGVAPLRSVNAETLEQAKANLRDLEAFEAARQSRSPLSQALQGSVGQKPVQAPAPTAQPLRARRNTNTTSPFVHGRSNQRPAGQPPALGNGSPTRAPSMHETIKANVATLQKQAHQLSFGPYV